MCQRYHVQHVFRSFLILIMSSPNPYLIQYLRYIWFKSDISVVNSLKSRVYSLYCSLWPNWTIYVQNGSQHACFPACVHMDILPQNRHIASFIGHVRHTNSPFSVHAFTVVERESRVVRFVFCSIANFVSKSSLREG